MSFFWEICTARKRRGRIFNGDGEMTRVKGTRCHSRPPWEYCRKMYRHHKNVVECGFDLIVDTIHTHIPPHSLIIKRHSGLCCTLVYILFYKSRSISITNQQISSVGIERRVCDHEYTCVFCRYYSEVVYLPCRVKSSIDLEEKINGVSLSPSGKQSGGPRKPHGGALTQRHVSLPPPRIPDTLLLFSPVPPPLGHLPLPSSAAISPVLLCFSPFPLLC